MDYSVFDDLPAEERDEMIADVLEYLARRDYVIFTPGTIEHHDADIRSTALEDAAEIVFSGHVRRRSPLQLASQLRNMSRRAYAVGLT